jgi:guanylate kinase
MQQAEEVASMQQELLQVTKLLRTSERESVAWEGLRKDYEAKEQQAQQVIEDLMLLVQQLRLQKAEDEERLASLLADVIIVNDDLERAVQELLEFIRAARASAR